MDLLAAFAVMALVLALVGIYGVISYSVSQRTSEIGIRMALGASPLKVVQMVTRESLLLTIPGLLAGIAAALAAFRFFTGMLVGVSSNDPLTFAGSTLFLLAVALLASYLPARRAVRMDPMAAVRCQ